MAKMKTAIMIIKNVEMFGKAQQKVIKRIWWLLNIGIWA